MNEYWFNGLMGLFLVLKLWFTAAVCNLIFGDLNLKTSHIKPYSFEFSILNSGTKISKNLNAEFQTPKRAIFSHFSRISSKRSFWFQIREFQTLKFELTARKRRHLSSFLPAEKIFNPEKIGAETVAISPLF